MLLVVAVAAALEVRTVPVADPPKGPISIICPQGQTTRIRFPEDYVRLKQSPGTTEAFGLKFTGVNSITVTPPAHPARGTVAFTGPTLQLILRLTTTPEGQGSEVRLERARASVPPEAKPAASKPPLLLAANRVSRQAPPSLAPPPPERVERAVPKPVPDVEPSLAPTTVTSPPVESMAAPSVLGSSRDTPSPPEVQTAAPTPKAGLLALDAHELLTLRPERIGREEGLPGQRPVVLEDALKSAQNVWLRFRAVGAASDKVQRVSWEHGQIHTFTVAPSGRDLRILVQLPRVKVSKKTRVEIALTSGDKYKFALSAPWFSSFLRGLF